MASNNKKSNSRLHFDKFIVVLFAVLAVGLVGGGYIAGSQAAKPVASPASIIILNEGVKIGENIKASVSYSKTTKNPVVGFMCYQNGTKVWGTNVGPAEALNPGAKLGGDWSSWIVNGGGPAQCEAYLWDLYYQGTQQQRIELAKTTFTVN